MADEEAVATAEEADGDEECEDMARNQPLESEPPVSVLKKARPIGAARKRKIVHRTRSGKRKDVETKTVSLKKMKEAVSMDLSDPSQLTMKEIIRRAEAIERAKAREEAAKKGKGKDKKGAGTTTASKDRNTPADQDMPAQSASILTPQVTIVNGRIVINQQSLVVGAQASTREDTNTYQRVEEDRPKLNYNSYSNRTPVERWKQEDTDLFYKALEQFGTDFELIQNLFPGRTRKQVKSKFKNEERLNPLRLSDALGHKTQDQSHHYRAILEMIKTEKPAADSDEMLLESLLQPVVTDERASDQPLQTQASTSGDKVHAEDNVDVAMNTVVLDKVKPDDVTAPASELIDSTAAVLPQSEVETITVKDDPPASEAPETLSSHQNKSKASGNPLGSYGKEPLSKNPRGSYGNMSRNPLGSYKKNPLGMYK
ncbi:uncharacterized protein [Physcomitrium patens]|uniref:SANT domain-containing protein n=1 Tax=Physcomitrium patens TaxID=3218 RepID=A0A2K1J0E1_PHYPA|nr:transcription factor TFIIIB component B''-like [Physcomitrium patens]PNR34996.1 hypothetical protein PHYPA_022895 [Physcomitrium patens]|eukprot:XP_024401733.1 transcription factor TFIIIB component B''-like [Physcomitrella patens]